jgi:hypothetical protein
MRPRPRHSKGEGHSWNDWAALSIQFLRLHPCLAREVARALAGGLGLRVEEEKVVGGGAISVDALILPPEGSGLAPVAVEADGPHHFFSNDKQMPTGTTVLKACAEDRATSEAVAPTGAVEGEGRRCRDV